MWWGEKNVAIYQLEKNRLLRKTTSDGNCTYPPVIDLAVNILICLKHVGSWLPDWRPPLLLVFFCAFFCRSEKGMLRAQKNEYVLSRWTWMGCGLSKNGVYTSPGWWFGTSILFSHILGIIIPIDELIFFRGVEQTTNRCLICSSGFSDDDP